jgi:hypothetical protein
VINWLKEFFKKYWTELFVFGMIFTVLMIDCIPDWTWINTDCDGPHYTYSAEYMYPAHKTSAPLFLLLGNLFLRIPFGSDPWNFALLSVFATMISCIFIYLIIKEKTNNKWFGIAGSLIFGSSALVISQSIIIETYALVTMFGVLAYYFCEKKQWIWCCIMLGLGGAVHHLIGIPIIIFMIAHKEMRSWKSIGIMSVFLLFYLYIPITNRAPYMWQSPNGSLASSFLVDNLSTMMMLFGGLSIWEFPKRLLDTIGIIGISFLFALIPIAIMFKQWKSKLFWLVVLPFVYYSVDLAPQTYVYCIPGIAFGSIIAGIGLSKIGVNYSGKIFINLNTKVITGIIIISSIIMLGINCNYFDVGRTLDPNLSARKFYSEELSKIPDGDILLAQQGWEWAMVFVYNKEEGRNILPVCVGTLASKQYQNDLRSIGIKFEDPNEDLNLIQLQNFLLKSIVNNNDNIWITMPSDPSTYGALVVGIERNESQLDQTPISIATDSPNWKWKPSNPYDIITGSIEVEEWIYIVFSNYSIASFMMMGGIGAVLFWIVWMIVVKKKKWSLRKHKEIEDVNNI